MSKSSIKTTMQKLRMVLVIEYNANPKYYNTQNPRVMARIDKESIKRILKEDPENFINFEFEPGDRVLLKVEPLENKAPNVIEIE